MLVHPHINPILLSLGPVQIHWYGVMYLLAFATAWWLGNWRAKRLQGQWSREFINDLIFFCIVGVVVGGRLGYMIFYALPDFMSDPFSMLRVWQGGMSFHGGLIGVVISMWLLGRRYQKSFFEIADFTAPLVPLGIAAGRLGNFINSELWGKVTDLPWAMVFPEVDYAPRHPSQLYELLLEGIVLFIIVWMFSSKPRPKMAVSGVFAMGYGIFRFMLEFFRVPDAQYGYLAWGWLTMGQLLSVPLIMVGVMFITLAYCRRQESNYI